MADSNKIEVKSCSKEDLLNAGIDVAQLLKVITAIDEDCNPDEAGSSLLEEPYEAVVARLTPVFDATPDMWRAFMHEDEIIGYWNCVALNDAHQKKIEDGVLRESYINVNNLRDNIHGEEVDVLFDSVCLHKDYQRKGLSGVVMKSIYDAMSALPPKGIKVNKVWASIWSKAGIKFFSKLGFIAHKENNPDNADIPDNEKHYIYYVDFDDMITNLENIIKEYCLGESK